MYKLVRRVTGMLLLIVALGIVFAASPIQAAPTSQYLPGPEGFLHISGTWRGPDYLLRVQADGNAAIEWFDGASATIFFYGMTRTGQTSFGLVQASSDEARISRGDEVEHYVPISYPQYTIPLAATQFTIRRSDGTPRWENTICHQGQNLAYSRYPC